MTNDLSTAKILDMWRFVLWNRLLFFHQSWCTWRLHSYVFHDENDDLDLWNLDLKMTSLGTLLKKQCASKFETDPLFFSYIQAKTEQTDGRTESDIQSCLSVGLEVWGPHTINYIATKRTFVHTKRLHGTLVIIQQFSFSWPMLSAWISKGQTELRHDVWYKNQTSVTFSKNSNKSTQYQ